MCFCNHARCSQHRTGLPWRWSCLWLDSGMRVRKLRIRGPNLEKNEDRGRGGVVSRGGLRNRASRVLNATGIRKPPLLSTEIFNRVHWGETGHKQIRTQIGRRVNRPAGGLIDKVSIFSAVSFKASLRPADHCSSRRMQIEADKISPYVNLALRRN